MFLLLKNKSKNIKNILENKKLKKNKANFIRVKKNKKKIKIQTYN